MTDKVDVPPSRKLAESLFDTALFIVGAVRRDPEGRISDRIDFSDESKTVKIGWPNNLVDCLVGVDAIKVSYMLTGEEYSFASFDAEGMTRAANQVVALIKKHRAYLEAYFG